MTTPRRPDPARRPDRPAPPAAGEQTVPVNRMRRGAPVPPPGPARRVYPPPVPPAGPARPVYPPPPRQSARPAPPEPREDTRWVTALLGSVIGVCAALAAAILLLGFWKPGFFLTTRLNIEDVQAGVRQVLVDDTTGYGLANLGDITCNDGRSPKVKPGTSFRCDVTVDGAVQTVTVTIEDSDGTYGVSAPR